MFVGHRSSWINVNNCPTRCDYIQFYYISANSSTCFGWYLHLSSGAHVNCNYSIRHWSNLICYLPLTWSRSDSSTRAEGSKYGSTSTICCNYNLRVLLMMGEGITRNMYSCLQKYNKTIYSRILLDNYWHYHKAACTVFLIWTLSCSKHVEDNILELNV